MSNSKIARKNSNRTIGSSAYELSCELNSTTCDPLSTAESHSRPSTHPARLVSLFGIAIQNTTMVEAIELIHRRLNADHPSRVSFVNADCVNIAARHEEYFNAVRTSSLVFADGIGMRLAGKILGSRVKENVNGTDLFPRLCQSLTGTGKRVFLLGARPGTAERVASWMERHYPGVDVCGTQHGFFDEHEEPQVIQKIRRSQADLLLVAFGVPKQEVWIRNHVEDTGVKVAIGVGGLFDFYGENVKRAPLWIRKIGMEWTYRLYQEPLRMWRRYLVGNWIFMARVLAHKLRRSSAGVASAGQ